MEGTKERTGERTVMQQQNGLGSSEDESISAPGSSAKRKGRWNFCLAIVQIFSHSLKAAF